MNVDLLSKDVDPIECKAFWPAKYEAPEKDTIYKTNQGAFQNFFCEFPHLIMLIEEDRLERLPIFDVSTMEMIVLLLIFGYEGRNERWNLRVVGLGHY